MGTLFGKSGFNFVWGIPLQAGSNSYTSTDTSGAKATIGQAVGSIVNEVSANYASQATGGNQPICLDGGPTPGDGAQPGLRFSGGQKLLTSSSVVGTSAGEESTIFCVFRGVSGGPFAIGDYTYLTIAATGWTVGAWGQTPYLMPGLSGPQNIVTTGSITSDLQIIALRFRNTGAGSSDTSTDIFRGIEGKVSHYTGTGAGFAGASRNTLTIGARQSTIYWNGDILHCSVSNTALSDANINYILSRLVDQFDGGKQFAANLQNLVLFAGDSITTGYMPTVAINIGNTGSYSYTNVCRGWPARCARLLGGRVRTITAAQSGTTIAQIQAVVTSGYGYELELANTLYAKRIVVALIGTNDILAGTSAAAILVLLQAFVTQMKALGATGVLLGTLPPSNGTALTAPQQAVLATVNAGILSLSGFDAITAAANVGVDSRLADTTYFWIANDVHPNDLGWSVIAQAFAKTLRPLLTIEPAAANVLTTNGNYGDAVVSTATVPDPANVYHTASNYGASGTAITPLAQTYDEGSAYQAALTVVVVDSDKGTMVSGHTPNITGLTGVTGTLSPADILNRYTGAAAGGTSVMPAAGDVKKDVVFDNGTLGLLSTGPATPSSVTQDQGGTNNLRATIGGVPSAGVRIDAYLLSDWSSGSVSGFMVKSSTYSDSAGAFDGTNPLYPSAKPLSLVPGSYVLIYSYFAQILYTKTIAF